jgi:hypothetical protein
MPRTTRKRRPASIDDLRPDDEMITDLKGISTNDFEEALVA